MARRHRAGVRTLRAAAQLLEDAAALDSLVPIASAIGCGGAVTTLDQELLREIGLTATEARMVDAPGALRALLLEVDDGAPLRNLLPRIATRLASRTPHVLWIVIATHPRRLRSQLRPGAPTASRRASSPWSLIAHELSTAMPRPWRRSASQVTPAPTATC